MIKKIKRKDTTKTKIKIKEKREETKKSFFPYYVPIHGQREKHSFFILFYKKKD